MIQRSFFLPARRLFAGLAASALSLTCAFAFIHAPAPASAAAGSGAVSIAGNQIVDAAGASIRLLGVDRSGTEYACAQGWGIFDGPSDATSISAMASWHITAVRVPLNEDCWLGINGVNSAFGGANYRSAIQAYVTRLHGAGLTAILDLHWSAPGSQLALGQQVMADADHSPAFWSSVASAFKADPAVVFDLYNEPHDISWACWLAGCTAPAGWQVAGMQSLLDAVRGTGATQPVLAGGLNWAGDLSQWLAHEPVDARHQLAASAHIYNFSQCNSTTCWNQTLTPVAAAVPVVSGEIGENDCGHSFIDSYMSWADAHGVSYLGWSWNTANCASGPALISAYDGTATAFGAGLKSHLAGLRPVLAGGYVLDGFGNLDPAQLASRATPPATRSSGTWPGWNIARSTALLTDGTGGYTLDGWGGLHPFTIGANPMPPSATMSAYWANWDIARGITMLSDGSGGYVLDGWGGVHPFATGANPMPPSATMSAYWANWDIARAITMLSDGSGGYVLDGWGGVHPFSTGANPMPPSASTSAYWPQQDVARAIALLPSGAGGYVVERGGTIAAFAAGVAPLPPPFASMSLPSGSEARSFVIAMASS